jgi:glycosyltransferase involved in cell wall biosynthesis
MKVAIVSRVFSPEVSAASGVLRSWAEEFRQRGFEVTVFTSRPPQGSIIDDPPGIRVRRSPVIRDRQHYVRGYLSYLSFDLLLFFRLLFTRRTDLYVVEPPPTTVAVVRIISTIRRTPYVVDAADYWTEAAELVTRSRLVIGTLRRIEAWGLEGSKMLFAAHEPLLKRFRAAGILTPAIPIGFGADTNVFHYGGEQPPDPPVFVYAGTYSEWHGAGILIEAMPTVLGEYPEARLHFYGNGEDREVLLTLAHRLGVQDAVVIHGPVSPTALSPILSSATASVTSLAPLPRNQYAMTTKIYSSIAAGCPVVFAGSGPTLDFIRDAGNPHVGCVVPYSVDAVASAMVAAARNPLPSKFRAELAQWSADNYSLRAIAVRVVDECGGIVRG